MKKVSFKGKEFSINQGAVHPDYSYFTFDQEEVEFREKYWEIKSGDTVLDVGASYGAYSLTACALGAIVYSFEPEISVYEDLKKNVQLNNWNRKCFTYNLGFWDQDSTINMKSYAPHWPQFAISSDYKMTTMDKFVTEQQIYKIDWIKIDVEGAECNVITGAINTIKKFKPKLIIECHIFLDNQIVDNIKKMLCPLGYSFEEVVRNPCIMLVSS